MHSKFDYSLKHLVAVFRRRARPTFVDGQQFSWTSIPRVRRAPCLADMIETQRLPVCA